MSDYIPTKVNLDMPGDQHPTRKIQEVKPIPSRNTANNFGQASGENQGTVPGRGDCDFNNKLKLLTETQFPYGPDCRLDRMLQCVFGHYSVSDEAVKLIEEAGFVSISDCRFADPDTAEDAKEFEDLIGSKLRALMKVKVRKAFQRLLSDDPVAAAGPKVTPTPARGGASGEAPQENQATPPKQARTSGSNINVEIGD